MLRLIPNILTFGRLVLTIVFLVMVLLAPPYYADGEVPFPGFLDIAFILFVIAGLTDIVDGIAARRLNVTSKFGRMLDPLVDKVLVCGAFICFAIIGEPKLFGLGTVTLAAIQWSVAGILIAREAYVTTLRHIAEARDVNFAATISGKVKMFLQSFAIGTVVIKMAHAQTAAWGYWFTTVTFAIMLAVTVISGLRATQRSCRKKTALDSRGFDYDAFVKGIISGNIKPATVKKENDEEGPLTIYDFPEFNCHVHAHFNNDTREIIGRAHIKSYSREFLGFIDNYVLSMLRHHSEDT